METKRDFLKKLSLITVGGMMAGTVAPAVASAAEKKSAAAKKSIGLQIYSLGKELFDDVPGGMKKIAQIGYDHIELAGYREGKMGTYTLPEYRKIVEGEGLKITSSHVNPPINKFTAENKADVIEFWKRTVADHVILGTKTLVQPGMPSIESHDDTQLVCEIFNQAGEIAKAAGIKWGYHNHNMEFKRVLKPGEKPDTGPAAFFRPKGDVVYDLLLDGTDPSLVFFEMDVYWTVMGANDPLEYFEKYPTRFPVLHIKDRSVLGQSGMMNFANIFTKAYGNGLTDYYVELEKVKTDITQFEGVKQCYDYLNNSPFVK